MYAQMKNAIAKFHDDEAGFEAIQVVMILAIAAVALIVIKGKWPAVKEWFNQQMDQTTNQF